MNQQDLKRLPYKGLYDKLRQLQELIDAPHVTHKQFDRYWQEREMVKMELHQRNATRRFISKPQN